MEKDHPKNRDYKVDVSFKFIEDENDLDTAVNLLIKHSSEFVWETPESLKRLLIKVYGTEVPYSLIFYDSLLTGVVFIRGNFFSSLTLTCLKKDVVETICLALSKKISGGKKDNVYIRGEFSDHYLEYFQEIGFKAMYTRKKLGGSIEELQHQINLLDYDSEELKGGTISSVSVDSDLYKLVSLSFKGSLDEKYGIFNEKMLWSNLVRIKQDVFGKIIYPASLVYTDPEGTVCGVILVTRISGATGFVIIMCTAPSHRGKGIAKKLLAQSIKKQAEIGIKQCIMWVTEGNVAENLYTKVGFKKIANFVSAYNYYFSGFQTKGEEQANRSEPGMQSD